MRNLAQCLDRKESASRIDASKQKKRGLRFNHSWSKDVMTTEERRAAESILARLIATAYATDHPELYRQERR
jgi:hypothetical protein